MGVGWGNRRLWRRLERRAVRGHQREVTSRLNTLVGSHLEATETVHGVIPGLWIDLPDWRIVLLGVTLRIATDLEYVALVHAPLSLEGVGRYGPFWWLRVTSGMQHLTMLGTHIAVVPRWNTGDEAMVPPFCGSPKGRCHPRKPALA
jgi:hypothetical protein